MNKWTIFSIIIVVVLAGVAFLVFHQQKRSEPNLKLQTTEPMKITSPSFKNESNIPVKYTCDGENINPPLEFEEVPAAAQTLVLIVDDPDAPGGTFVHWTAWNISPDTSGIQENSVPEEAMQGMTNFGSAGYGGPCPPSGSHRYFFKLYALDTALDLDSSAEKKDVEDAMKGHIVDEAQLMGEYERQ